MSLLLMNDVLMNYWEQVDKQLKSLQTFIQTHIIIEEKRHALQQQQQTHGSATITPQLDKTLKQLALPSTYNQIASQQQPPPAQAPSIEFISAFQTKYKEHANIVEILKSVTLEHRDIIRKQEDVDKTIRERTGQVMLEFSKMVRTSIDQLINSKTKTLVPILTDYTNQYNAHVNRITEEYTQVHEPALKQSKKRFYDKFTQFLESKITLLHDMYSMSRHFLSLHTTTTTIASEQARDDEFSARLQESIEILQSLSILIEQNTMNDLPTTVVHQAYDQLSEFVMKQEELLYEIIISCHHNRDSFDLPDNIYPTTHSEENNDNQEERVTDDDWQATLIGLRQIDPLHHQLYQMASSHVASLVEKDKATLKTNVSKQTNIEEMIRTLDRQTLELSRQLYNRTTNTTLSLTLRDFQDQRQRLESARDDKIEPMIKQTQLSLTGNEAAVKAWKRFLEHIHESSQQWFVKDHDQWESLLQEEHKLQSVWRHVRATHTQKLMHVKRLMTELQEQEVAWFEADAKLHQQTLFLAFLTMFHTSIKVCVEAINKQYLCLDRTCQSLDYAVSQIQAYDAANPNNSLSDTQVLFGHLNPLKSKWREYIHSHISFIFREFSGQFETRYNEYINALRYVATHQS